MIQITTNSGSKFDLPENFTISVEDNSVMTGKQGSFSLPIDLPWSDNNVKLIHYPTRHDRKHAFVSLLEVSVSAGLWVRRAKLNIDSAQEGIGISCELYFGESRFYQEIENVKLPDIFASVIRNDYNMYADLDTRIRAWLNHFEKVQTGEWTDDYYVFPVCALMEKHEEKQADNALSADVYYEQYTILNRPDVPTAREIIVDGIPYSSGQYAGATETNAAGKTFYKLAAHKTWTFQESVDPDSNFITYQKGYGATPFLKYTTILQRIFQHFGYSLLVSEFADNPAFKALCYINNTADAIMDGLIHYSQLVPDKTISEFMEHVENSFGVEFIFNEINNTVKPRFWKDLLTESPTKSVDGLLEDYPKINYASPKSLRLTTEKSALEDKLTYNSFNELFQKYQLALLEDPAGVKFCRLDKKSLQYLCYEWRQMEISGQMQDVPFLLEKVPAFLDYGLINNDIEERNCGFQSIPLVHISLDERSPLSVALEFTQSNLPGLAGISLDQSQPEDSILARIPFINTIRHLKTIQVNSGKDNEGNPKNLSESRGTESGDELGIYPCFYHGFAVALNDAPNVEKTFFASQFRYDNNGGIKIDFDLSTLELYNTFWKDYADTLQSSFHEIVGPAKMDADQLLSIDKSNPYFLHGQSVLPEGVQYEITNDGLNVVELKLRTLKNYI